MRSGVSGGVKRMASPSPSPEALDRGFRGRIYQSRSDSDGLHRHTRAYSVCTWDQLGGPVVIEPRFPGEPGSTEWQRAAGLQIRGLRMGQTGTS